MTMTDEQIIKALRCCSRTDKTVWCPDCPLFGREETDCLPQKAKAALDLINRQKTEIKDLKLSNIILKAKMTIEFVPKENPHLLRYIIRGSGYTAQGESLLDAMKAFEEKVIAGLDAEEHTNIANKRAAKGGEEQ